MYNLEDLLQQYQSSPKLSKLVSALSHGQSKVLIQGMKGSLGAFVMAAAVRNKKGQYIYLTSDKEEAAVAYSDLSRLLGEPLVHFLPDSFRQAGAYERYDGSNALLRTQVVKAMDQKDANFVIVTYPEAIIEKLHDLSAMQDQTVYFKVGTELNVDFLMELLLDLGYERQDFVYEPGQFSVRGGIIDLFTYGVEWPLRVEMFDDEIESIRKFHPNTQRSLAEVDNFSLLPDIKQLDQKSKISFFDVVQDEATIIFGDADLFFERWNMTFERLQQACQMTDFNMLEEQKHVLNTSNTLGLSEAVDRIGSFRQLFFKKPVGLKTVDAEITWSAHPQTDFNRNFNLLIEDMKARPAYQNILFVDQVKQIERFETIFEDLNAGLAYLPINASIHEGFIDDDLKLNIYTDHQIFQRIHRTRVKRGYSKSEALNLKLLRELKPGDFVTHINHGVGKFSGLETLEVNGKTQESIRIMYRDNDLLYVSINALHKISKLSDAESRTPKLSKLGTDAWKNLKNKTKKRVKDIADDLIKLYAQRMAAEGFAFPPDNYLQNELEASFIYEDTPDQMTTTVEIKEDMMKPYPMDRLICGDVGFGKTEIAIRAAFKAVLAGKQVALLVPTTILAMQHALTFRDRLCEFGCTVDYVNRFRSAKEKKTIFERTEAGEVDILIGTHAILSKKLKFKDLGLLIVDEEQKFGVAHKEKLKQLKVNVDTLTLTATPIPRTLQFSLMAARDMSILRTAPPNRLPVHTELRVFNEELIQDAIYKEIERGGQVFFVHNRVKSLEDMHVLLKRLCPDVTIKSVHGQMNPAKIEEHLKEFVDGDFDVLLCTNIIETGLDIPNVNTIIINNANNFGLSDLHQLRGRVGRSNRKAYCYLITPPLSTLSSESRKRLKTIEEFADLGSGFQIAMRDMDIRGAGNLLGGEQSGFMNEIGFQTYQRILEEAIEELKETKFRDLFSEELKKRKTFVNDIQIDIESDMLIPADYISSTQERLAIYTQLDNLKDEKEIEEFKQMLTDRFGPYPEVVNQLFTVLRIRWMCATLGFSQVLFKGNVLRLYFIDNPQSYYYESDTYSHIMQYVSSKGEERLMSLHQKNNRLFIRMKKVASLEQIEMVMKSFFEEENVAV